MNRRFGGLGSATAFITGSTAAQGVARLFSSWLVGRTSGPLQFGDLTAGLALGQFLVILGPNPAGTAASKFAVYDGEEETRHQSGLSGAASHVVTRSLQVIPLLAVIGGLLSYLAYGLTVGESVAVGGSVLGLAFWAVGRGILFGREQFTRAASIDITLALLSVIGTVLLLNMGISGVYALVPMTGIYSVYAVVLLRSALYGATADPISSVAKREVDSFIFYGAVGSIASAGFLHLTVFLLRAMSGSEAAGIFGAALTMSMPLLMIVTSFSSVFYPRLSRLWHEKKITEFRALTDRFTRFGLSFLFVPVAILIVFSDEFVDFLWGNQFENSGRLLPVLLVAAFVRGVTSIPVAALTAGPSWGMKVAAASSVCGASVGLLFILASMGEGGPEVAAVGYLVGVILIACVPLIVTWRMGRYTWAGLMTRGFTALLVVLWLSYNASSWPVLGRASLLCIVCVVVAVPELAAVRRRARRTGPG